MSGNPHRKKARPLCERLLVHLAEKLGPALDVLDVTDHSGLKVRDLILHFAKEMPLRHTFGSQLARKGVSLLKIAKLMGNSPAIAARHYINLVPEEMADDVAF